MKKILVILTMAAVFMMSGTALGQAEVEWKGFYWNAYQGALIAKNNGYLQVEPTGDSGAAYSRAPIDFRSARTPWIEATFFDDGQSSGIQLVMKNTSRAYTEIGAGRLLKNYWIYWDNLLPGGGNGLVGTAITRTPGQHTVKLGMQENGTVDYWIDDVRVWSTNNINPESFDIIFLAAQGSTGTFIDYQVGTDYRAPQLVVDFSIDIKPGGNPNNINLKSKGVVPVAILTDETFDAATVDPLSIAFGPDGASEAHGRGHIEDVDGDGDLDLVLHFRIQDTGIACGDVAASLTGETFSGTPIKGSDSINTVGCK
jgi:hypothetical protein